MTRQRLAALWREVQALQRRGAFTPDEFAALRGVLEGKAGPEEVLPDARPAVARAGDEVIDAWEVGAVLDAEELPAGAHADAHDAVALFGEVLDADDVDLLPGDEILDAEPAPD
jgi:hypothetical protein